jgi:hypothetical protein
MARPPLSSHHNTIHIFDELHIKREIRQAVDDCGEARDNPINDCHDYSCNPTNDSSQYSPDSKENLSSAKHFKFEYTDSIQDTTTPILIWYKLIWIRGYCFLVLMFGVLGPKLMGL